MKNISMILGLMFIINISVIAQNRSINFETGTFEEILKKADAENKIIMMDAYTTWCGPCKWMSKNVFTDDEVADFYNANFINAKIDMEAGEGPELAKKYGVKAYPTILFINGKGEKVHVGVGSSPPKQFIELGKKAKDPKGNLAYFDSQYESNKTNATFLIKYLTVLKESYIPYDDVLNYYWEVQKEEDFINEVNWTLIKDFVDNSESNEFKYLVAHKANYISKYGIKDVEKKIYDVYMSKMYSALRKAGKDHKVYYSTKEDFKKINYHREKELFLNTDMVFYKYVDKQPEKYCDLAIQLFEEIGVKDPGKLNEFAWGIFENSDDRSKLNIGLKMIESALKTESNHAYMDTKAALLFKLEKYEEALKTEEKALKMAEEAGEDTKSYIEFIEKIKAKM